MTIPETCGLWDIDYNSNNWEPEFKTIFVTCDISLEVPSPLCYKSLLKAAAAIFNFNIFVMFQEAITENASEGASRGQESGRGE